MLGRILNDAIADGGDGGRVEYESFLKSILNQQLMSAGC
jgi:hypothetical protein